jgi:uncharacterized protein YigA (DUF484 family)
VKSRSSADLDPGQVAVYLAQHPDFFEQHPQLLGGLTLAHPQNGRAISLLERQVQLLRERARLLETQLAEMVRHGHDNDARVARLAHWAVVLLGVDDPLQLAPVAVAELKAAFDIPYAALRIFHPVAAIAALECARPVSPEAIQLAASMILPYCGTNIAFEAAHWLGDEAHARSVAMIPLRAAAGQAAFGLLVLGSPDLDRFTSAMGTEFLVRIGDLAAAALARLAR